MARLILLAASLVLVFSQHARADQVTLVDETYTHSAMNTMDSHYRVTPKPGTPKDWTKPVNYAGGSLHVLLEVKTKPSDAATKFQVCFEKGSVGTCAALSAVYTKPTKLEWDDLVSNFWNASAMNWANGVDKAALIIKDNNNGKPQGDPKYVPTDLHVVVTLVSAGSKYNANPSIAADAGVDTGKTDAGKADAGKTDAGVAVGDAGDVEPPVPDAAVARVDAAVRSTRDAATLDARVDTTSEPDDTDSSEQPATAKSDDGCALAARGGSGWFALLLAIAWSRRRGTSAPKA